MKLTVEQLQAVLRDRQEQFRVYQAKADTVREQIRVIQESIDAADAQ